MLKDLNPSSKSPHGQFSDSVEAAEEVLGITARESYECMGFWALVQEQTGKAEADLEVGDSFEVTLTRSGRSRSTNEQLHFTKTRGQPTDDECRRAFCMLPSLCLHATIIVFCKYKGVGSWYRSRKSPSY